ncbi:ribokinase [Roseibium aquae]|uniref:Ribokinase n=1 Tax=Roseibium aquae TaxID=1323746 RepID=A0A916TMY6_9HYPH|nr:ribokinase [Roseibium aquae]GGB57466.1 ribokinase [Roseibium aquae]
MIVVFGSINLDLVICVPRLPRSGETVSGPDHQAFPGGKGANQALAARRAGADVAIVGAVGRDAFADLALENLRGAGVRLDQVRRIDRATGLAMIGVDPAGENQIMVAAGANAQVRSSWLEGMLATGDTLLVQGEISTAEIRGAMARARQVGARTVFNPAPVPAEDLGDLLGHTDVLVVNEAEAEEIARRLEAPADREGFAAHFGSGTRVAVVTLGSAGIVAYRAGERFRMHAPEADILDTTGAGDAFCGALAAGLDRGARLEDALRCAVAAGTLACTATGAQSSVPGDGEIAQFALRVVRE